MTITFDFTTTLIGSFPQPEAAPTCRHILASADIPAWPQLPRRDFRESMYVQYSQRLPGIVIDPAAEKVWFDTTQDLSGALERFYEAVLAEDLDYFALDPDFAAGFYAMLAALPETPGEWVKGHITGPVSFGLTVTDQALRAGLYDETLADAIIKNLALHARWQARRLKAARPQVIIFVDEPYLASYGSAYIALSRPQVVAYLNEVFAAIQAEGALAGVHCCGNTDWSLLMETSVDILNLDALGYIENLSLYPAELARFIARGGRVAWGALPNDAAALTARPQEIAARLIAGLDVIARRAAAQGLHLPRRAWLGRSLLTPACGLGSADAQIAEHTLALLAPVQAEVLAQLDAAPA